MSSAPRSEHFSRLVAGQPDNELFRFSLAQALLAEGRPADAIGHLECCAGKKPDWMMPRIILGKTLLGLNRPAEARAWLAQALQLATAQLHEEPEKELQALLKEI